MTNRVPASLYNIVQAPPKEGPALSVVVPMYNEAENAGVLIEEIATALRGKVLFEIIAVNDCSTDTTAAVLSGLKERFPELRPLSHGQNAGQSRGVRTGIMAARSPVISTLDGDGQNNPADIPALYTALTRDGAPASLMMVAGERQKRRDTAAKRYASRIANGVRKNLLGDDANDTGCGLKVFYRDAFLRLPYFDHIHRYLPALMKREGYEVEFLPVSARERLYGQSKYTNFQRAAVAIRDLMGVMWLKSRHRHPGSIEEL
ncbi:glycosyltransferase family 2 protein [Parvularcula sp. IMCC14364]|uniref:glycosyltransferase family 2 protein n=1 Tax=Parvularcula sp. IMCC14364 TaxID=3067902 RepID=UPI0027429D7F|nr:glycosyltransferase family 2 protein [Parvularcula sp. IMCC14364]